MAITPIEYTTDYLYNLKSIEKINEISGITNELKENVDGLIDSGIIGVRKYTQSDTPTVTFSTGGDGGSLIADRFPHFPAVSLTDPTPFNDSAFSYLGIKSDSLAFGPSQSVIGKTFTGADVSSPTGYWNPKVSFDCDASEIEIQVRARTTGNSLYQVEVNGQPLTNGFQTVSVTAGSQYKIRLVFSDARLRNISFSTLKIDFRGVIIPKGYRAVRPVSYRKTKMVVLTNSICAGSAFDTFRWQTWPSTAGRLLGLDVYDVSIGSTGYINSHPPTYISRIVDIHGIDPDIIVFGDHYNDLGESEAVIKQAMDDLVSSLKLNFPRAKLMMLGGWVTTENLSAKQIALDSYVRQLCSENSMTPIMYTNPYGNWGDIEDWQSGVDYIQGMQVRYQGCVWECRANHTSVGVTINTTGFRPALVVTDSNKTATLLADQLHPTVSTCNTFGAAFSYVMSKA